MAIKQLTPTLSVTAQLTPADIAQAAAMGFRAILCNRPDGEGAGPPANGNGDGSRRRRQRRRLRPAATAAATAAACGEG